MPLPLPTREWILAHASHDPQGVESFRRSMIIRWMLWQEGDSSQAIPGYAAPPADCGKGHPAGWSRGSFKRLACMAKQEEIRTALKRPTPA